MNAKNNDVPLFFSLLSRFKRFMEGSPPDPEKTPASSLNSYQLRQLERWLRRDCEIEANRKKLERYWQELSKYE